MSCPLEAAPSGASPTYSSSSALAVANEPLASAPRSWNRRGGAWPILEPGFHVRWLNDRYLRAPGPAGRPRLVPIRKGPNAPGALLCGAPVLRAPERAVGAGCARAAPPRIPPSGRGGYRTRRAVRRARAPGHCARWAGWTWRRIAQDTPRAPRGRARRPGARPLTTTVSRMALQAGKSLNVRGLP